MARHTYFEELCALAPLGSLSPSQLQELDEHIGDCDECREMTVDYDRLYRQAVPTVNESDEEFIESRRSDIRAAVLRSVTAIDSQRDQQSVSMKVATLPRSPKAMLSLVLGAGLAAASLAAAAFWSGAHFYGGTQRHQSTGVRVASAPPPAASLPAAKQSQAAVARLAQAQSEAQDARLAAALDAERQHSAELAKKLSVEDSDLAQAIAAQDALRAQVDQQTQALAATKANLSAKQAQLEQAQSAKSSDTATLVSLEYQVQDLTRKLDTQTASIDRERDLLSHGREIRDIIGARNLHIIDVYDTDAGGETKKPFARAFYTEGKSLVYYAYDLPQQKLDEGRFTYVAWGESNGNKATVRKIGILFHDDQTQKRWSLSFSDPKVLAEIDSVFITLERNDDEVAQPKGKRMLTAYLGTPANHP